MTKIAFDLTGTFTVSKGSRSDNWMSTVGIDLAAIPPELVEPLLLHGLKQKVADAASGAKSEDEALASMQKAVDAILKGEWSSRTAGDGATMETVVGRSVMRNAFKEKVGGKSEAWATFTGLSDAEQIAKLDAWLAGPNGEALADSIAAEIELRKARAANKAKAAKAVTFEL